MNIDPKFDPLNFRTDWHKLLVHLERIGCGVDDVAKCLTLRAATVRSWKHGVEPSHSQGQALLAIYENLVPKNPT